MDFLLRPSWRILLLVLLFSKYNFSYSQNAPNSPPTLEMVLVKGGSFQMGVSGGLAKESPEHRVSLNRFYISKYEITQAQWKAVMGSNPATFSGCDSCPVEEVRWKEVEVFLQKLNAMSGRKYRLPTEAEWEYAAMGGQLSKGYAYPGSNNLDEVAWHVGNAENKTHPVGRKKPNELGLYDMAGNVWELCSDWYSPSWYKRSPSENPRNDKRSWWKLLRGGSWRSAENRCYTQARNRDVPDHHKDNGGFRVVE